MTDDDHPFADLEGERSYVIERDGSASTLTVTVNGRRLTVERDDGTRQVLEPPRARRLADVTAAVLGEDATDDRFVVDLRAWADAHRPDDALGVSG